MAFFDKIGDFAKSVGDKTNGMIEITKLNSKINGENTKINELYSRAGAICFEKYTGGTPFDPDLVELFEAIKASQAVIAETQAEIAAIKEATGSGVTCKACGVSNPEGTKFCRECGAKLEPPAPKDGVFCPSCGSANPTGTRFCSNCGTKLGE